MSIGLRVFRTIERPPAELVARLGECDTADLSDVMRHAKTTQGIRPTYSPIQRVSGPAVTVSLPIGGRDIQRLGMDACQPGDILVISVRGQMNFSAWGGAVSHRMAKRGLAGVIVDGAVRDVDEIQDSGLPVFARGVATSVGLAEGPGEVNVPVACGGAVIAPGDIVVADANGVVAVPPADAEKTLSKIAKLHALHEKWRGEQEIPGLADIVQRVTNQGCEFVR